MYDSPVRPGAASPGARRRAAAGRGRGRLRCRRAGAEHAARLPLGAHSLRAGFVSYAHLRGASDRAIAHQTRHRSLAAVGTYVRVHEAWTDNAATMLGI